MIGPKKKISKSKSNKRFWTWQKIELKRFHNKSTLTRCKNCGSIKLMHRVCWICWFYRWVQVLTIKSKKDKNVIDA